MTLTCPVCKRKFHKGKTSAFGRQSRHLWSKHPDYMKRKIKSGQRKAKKKLTEMRPLDKEFMAIDDILLAQLGRGTNIPYNAQHEQLGGLLLEALIPIAISAIQLAVKRRKQK
ncbi:hypothetical protein ES703_89486 [subsurface metagenome]